MGETDKVEKTEFLAYAAQPNGLAPARGVLLDQDQGTQAGAVDQPGKTDVHLQAAGALGQPVQQLDGGAAELAPCFHSQVGRGHDQFGGILHDTTVRGRTL